MSSRPTDVVSLPRAASTQTMGAQVIQRILALISSGKLVAGQRLVETALARELGVGTMPVREALRMLAGDGVVEIVPHRGATLRAMSPKEICDTLKGIVGMLMVALDELAQGEDKQLGPRLRRIAARIIERQREGDGLAALNGMADFQLYLMAASGNRYIADSVRKVHFDYYNPQVLRFISADDLGDIAATHATVTELIERRDFEAAKAIFRNNVGRVVALLSNAPGEPGDGNDRRSGDASRAARRRPPRAT